MKMINYNPNPLKRGNNIVRLQFPLLLKEGLGRLRKKI
jgi:hypothetical protein